MTPIQEFPGYFITESGDIFSCIDRYDYQRKLTPTLNRYNGYYSVMLTKDKRAYRRYVHRLMGLALIPNPDNKREINHINGNKKDNRLENLEWATSSENKMHAFRLGLRPNQDGENNWMSKLKANDVLDIRALSSFGALQDDLAEAFGVSQSLIALVISKQIWKSV